MLGRPADSSLKRGADQSGTIDMGRTSERCSGTVPVGAQLAPVSGQGSAQPRLIGPIKTGCVPTDPALLHDRPHVAAVHDPGHNEAYRAMPVSLRPRHPARACRSCGWQGTDRRYGSIPILDHRDRGGASRRRRSQVESVTRTWRRMPARTSLLHPRGGANTRAGSEGHHACTKHRAC